MPRVAAHAPGHFCWIDLLSIDLELAVTFYRDLFGWTARLIDTDGGTPYAVMLLGEDPVAGIGAMNTQMTQEGVPPTWNSYVAVEDVDETVQRVLQAEGAVLLPPWDVLDAGRTAFVQDPSGAPLGLWQARGHLGAARVREPGTLRWNELATRDVDAAAAFFTEVFGWHPVETPVAPTRYVTARKNDRDVGGLLQMTQEWGEMPPHWSVYFEVGDAGVAARRVRELGGTVHFGPFDAPVGRLVVCADDQGASFYMIELVEAMRAKS